MTTQEKMPHHEENFRKTLMNGLTLKAPSLIVTIYGDVVVPRGGVLWMGTLIETCKVFGISETQVRTAVSRLMNSGRLKGIRDGRRSYYELTDSARDEFKAAARLLFEPIPEPNGWIIHNAPEIGADALRQQHLGALGSHVYIRPDHAHLPCARTVTFRSVLTNGEADMAILARSLWPLDNYATEYRELLGRFGPLMERVRSMGSLTEADCVFARLLLVHRYRHVLLADPLLPAAFLPVDWPGWRTRSLFADLYIALSPGADRRIGTSFEGRKRHLPQSTHETERRMTGLRAVRHYQEAERT